MQFNRAGDRIAYYEYLPGSVFPIGVWELIRPTETFRLPIRDLGHESIAISVGPDERLLAIGGDAGLALWDLSHSRRLALLPIGEVRAVVFLNDLVVTGGARGVILWPLDRSGKRLRVGPPRVVLDKPVKHTDAGLHHGIVAATLFDQNDAMVIDVDRPGATRTLGPLKARRFKPVAVHPQRRWVASPMQSDVIGVWDSQSGNIVVELASPVAEHVDWSADGRWLMAQDPREYVIWEAGTWRKVRHGVDPAFETKADKGDGLAADAMRPGTAITLIDPATLQEVAVIPTQRRAAEGCARFLTRSPRVAAVHEIHGFATVWDLGRVRANLAEMGLDWNAPPYAPRPADFGEPNEIEVDLGELAPAVSHEP